MNDADPLPSLCSGDTKAGVHSLYSTLKAVVSREHAHALMPGWACPRLERGRWAPPAALQHALVPVGHEELSQGCARPSLPRGTNHNLPTTGNICVYAAACDQGVRILQLAAPRVGAGVPIPHQ